MKKKSPKNIEKQEKEKLRRENTIKKIDDLKSKDIITGYLGNKGYSIYKICLTPEIIEFIKNELTVKPFVQNSLIQPESFPIYQESDKKIYVPRFWGIKYFGYPKSIKISSGTNIDLKFNGNLRDYQTEVVNAYLKSIDFYNNQNNGSSSALIELKCGGGKTVLGLKLVEIIKKKTIIFVQKTFLKNQWIERIQQFLPQARIGTIQGPVIDIEDKDIVIAMVQSISMKSYPDSLFDSFGFSIHDEVHHMSSETFSNCLKKCTTLYSLGLSATMNRKDGLTFVFKMYLGEICYKNKESDDKKDNVLVKAIDYNVDDDEYNEVERDYRGNTKYSTMISKISNFTYRSDFIINVMKNELIINKNQQIILLAHTKALLNYLYKEIVKQDITSVGFYIGGMKEHDLKQSENKQIILATYAMAAEALDIKSLTTLLLATPKSDIVQAVGRILREKHSQPLIIDIIDSHEPFQGQFAKRRSFYNEKSYKIIRTTNENYIEYIKDIRKITNDKKTLNNDNIDYNELNTKFWKELVYKPRNKNAKSNIISIDTESENKCLITI
tara:strand:+ start:7925 stop:9586 length:1662 start_codon:yes stop_codon:yes gene_type:complete